MQVRNSGTPGVLAVVLLGCVLGSARADDWPQWLGPQRDGVWREQGILGKFPEGGPKVVWRKPIGAGYTGPAVAGDRVYVMDRDAPPLPKGIESPGKDGIKGKERVLCLDAATGNEIWKYEYDCLYKIYYPGGPRCTPTVQGGKVYTLGAMGNLCCLDAATGKPLWTKDLLKEYETKPPVWGYSSHPLVDGQLVYSLVGGEGSVAVAFDKDTGKEVWKALSVKEVGYAPPTMITFDGKKQLIIFHTEAVNSLDPLTGKLLWTQKFPIDVEPVRPAITVSQPRLVDDKLFFTEIHHGPLMMQLAHGTQTAKLLWKGKSDSASKPDGLHSLMSTPIFKDGHIYGICVSGEMRCLDASSGKQLWETLKPATKGRKTFCAHAFLIEQGDKVLVFNDAGELIISRMTPQGYEEIDRALIIKPTLVSRGRDVAWAHPAFAHRCVFVRNDEEIICYSLAEPKA